METVRAYNCFVRLGGEMQHEVPKFKISANEIMLLRYIHGRDSVVRVTLGGTFKDYNYELELQRMAREYGVERVSKVFNVMQEYLTGELEDDEEKPQLISMEVIEAEAEANGRQIDVKEVMREAVTRVAAPAAPESGPTYLGDTQTAKSIHEGVALE